MCISDDDLEKSFLLKTEVDTLKSYAGKYCIDIYNDFDDTELEDFPKSVQEAWKIGKELHLALYTL